MTSRCRVGATSLLYWLVGVPELAGVGGWPGLPWWSNYRRQARTTMHEEGDARLSRLTEDGAKEWRQRFFAMVLAIYRACEESQRQRTVFEGSPFTLEKARIPQEPEPETVADIHRQGRFFVSRTEVAATHSFAAMIRQLNHSDDVGPASSALYPLARAAIEGAAIARYLYDPKIDLDERIVRFGQLMMWSEHNNLTFMRELGQAMGNNVAALAEEQWGNLTQVLNKAGIEQIGADDKKRWHKLRRGTAVAGRYEILDLMRAVHVNGPLIYRILSAAAHHAPWQTAPNSRMTSTDEDGAYFGTEIPQSEQVQLMANVAVALLVAHTAKAEYYGADTGHITQIANEAETFFNELTAVLISEETRE